MGKSAWRENCDELIYRFFANGYTHIRRDIICICWLAQGNTHIAQIRGTTRVFTLLWRRWLSLIDIIYIYVHSL